MKVLKIRENSMTSPRVKIHFLSQSFLFELDLKRLYFLRITICDSFLLSNKWNGFNLAARQYICQFIGSMWSNYMSSADMGQQGPLVLLGLGWKVALDHQPPSLCQPPPTTWSTHPDRKCRQTERQPLSLHPKRYNSTTIRIYKGKDSTMNCDNRIFELHWQKILLQNLYAVKIRWNES